METIKPPRFVFVLVKNRHPVDVYFDKENLFRHVKLFYGNKFHDSLIECFVLDKPFVDDRWHEYDTYQVLCMPIIDYEMQNT